MQRSLTEHDHVVNYNLSIRQKIAELISVFAQKEIKVILLKGIAILGEGGKEFEGRIMGDVDLLVHSNDFEKAKEVLSSEGYSPIGGNMQNAEIYGRNEPVEIFIDLHRSLFNPASPSQKLVYSPNENALWNRCKNITFKEQSAFTLGFEDRIIYLCFHMLKERFSKEKWIKDLIFIIKNNKINETEFIRIAKENGTYKLCSLVIDYLNSNYDAQIDILRESAPEKTLHMYRLESALFRFILRHTKGALFILRESLWLIAMDSVIKKLKFLWNLVYYVPKKLGAKLCHLKLRPEV